MKILDTNLWVFGTLRTNEQAAELLAEIDRGVDEDIREVLAERWGKAERDIAITDVREAMVAISDWHIDEIAAVMEEWGCDA